MASAWTYHGGGVLSKERSDGRRVYFIKYRRNGRAIVERVGLTEEAARKRIEARRDQATDPNWTPPPVKRREERERERAEKQAEAPTSTVADLLDVYRRECVRTKRRADWQGWMISLLESEFGTLALSDLTAERVEAWRDRLTSEGKSPSTIRKYVYFLSGVYSDCMRTAKGRRLVQDNPCRLVALPDEPKGLRKALTAAQAAAILTAARDDAAIYRWAALVLHTGMRVEEAQRLRWEDAAFDRKDGDLTGARFAVHETKTGRPRYVEAGARLLPDLAKWHDADGPEPSGPILGEAFESFPYQRWHDVFRTAEIPWGSDRGAFTTRNLRTTFCMLAFQNGARPEELVQQTGHSLATLFGYYAEASREQRRRAVDALPDLRRAGLRAVRE